MTEEPDDVIAPRDKSPFETHNFLQQMLVGGYAYGQIVEYHGLHLVCSHSEAMPNVWDVYWKDNYIESINLHALRTVSELEEILDEIVAYGPESRKEWVNR